MKTTIVFLSTLTICYAAVTLTLDKRDAYTGDVKLRCSKNGSDEDYTAKIYYNDELIYSGNQKGDGGTGRIQSGCSSDSSEVTEIQYHGYSNSFDLKKGERNIVCRGIDPNTCRGKHLNTFFGHHSYYNCTTADCLRHNVITDRGAISPLFDSLHLTAQDIQLEDHITFSTVDLTQYKTWGSIPTVIQMKYYAMRFINAVKSYKRLQIITVMSSTTINFPYSGYKYILYQNKDSCGKPSGFAHTRSTCTDDYVTYYKKFSDSDRSVTINSDVICNEKVNFLLFTEPKETASAVSYLTSEYYAGSYDKNDKIPWAAGPECGVSGDVSVEVYGRVMNEFITKMCPSDDERCELDLARTMEFDLRPFRNNVCGCTERPNPCGAPRGKQEFSYVIENVKNSDTFMCEIDSTKSAKFNLLDFESCDTAYPTYQLSGSHKDEITFICGKCVGHKVGFVSQETNKVYTFGSYIQTIPLAVLSSDVSSVTCVNGLGKANTAVGLITYEIMEQIHLDQTRCKIIEGSDGNMFCETDKDHFAEMVYYARKPDFISNDVFKVVKSSYLNVDTPSVNRYGVSEKIASDTRKQYTCSCGKFPSLLTTHTTLTESVARGDEENKEIVPFSTRTTVGCAFKHSVKNISDVDLTSKQFKVKPVYKRGDGAVIISKDMSASVEKNELSSISSSNFQFPDEVTRDGIIGYKIICDGAESTLGVFDERLKMSYIPITDDATVEEIDNFNEIGVGKIIEPTDPPVTGNQEAKTTTTPSGDEVTKTDDDVTLDPVDDVTIDPVEPTEDPPTEKPKPPSSTTEKPQELSEKVQDLIDLVLHSFRVWKISLIITLTFGAIFTITSLISIFILAKHLRVV